MVKKTTEWFLGSNLQCCLHATVLLTVKYSAELNKYILLVRVICEKYRFRGQENFPSSLRRLGIFVSPLNQYFRKEPSLTGYICIVNDIYNNQLSMSFPFNYDLK